MLAGLAVAGLAGLAGLSWILLPDPSAPRDTAGKPDYATVRRGVLTISIEVDGTIVSREQYTVATDLSEDQRLEVEGQRCGNWGNPTSSRNPTTRGQPERDERAGTSLRGNSLNSLA